MAKPPTFTAFPPASIIPASGPNTLTGKTPAASNTSASPMTRPWKPSNKLAQLEGILPALESAHAFAHLERLAPSLPKDKIIIVNLSGRGDKDCQEVARLIGK